MCQKNPNIYLRVKGARCGVLECQAVFLAPDDFRVPSQF